MTGLTVHMSMLADAVGRVEEQLRFEFLALPEGWLALGGILLLAGLIWMVIWMYRHEGRAGASMRRRMILGGVRATVMVVLAVIWLEPVMARYLHRWIDSYTLVLVDTSASMDLTDTYRDDVAATRTARVLEIETMEPTRRADVVARVLEQNDKAFLTELAKNNRVKLYTFDETPQLQYTLRAASEKKVGRASPDMLVGPPEGGQSPPYPSQGAATNIERAVRRAVEAQGGAPIAAVIVLSDGGFNSGAGAEATARLAADRKIPVYTVGIGDPSPPRNIRITDVLAPADVLQKDPFAITARLATLGAAGQRVRVNLRERRDGQDGDGRIIDGRDLFIETDGIAGPITFELRRRRLGRYVYTVEAPVLNFESVADDNAKQVTVNVIDARVRVLLVAGHPSWEYRFVSRLLERDETFNVSCWLVSADRAAVRDGNTFIDHLPLTVEELFAYDAVILLDPAPAELSPDWCARVDKLVTEHGGGLLFAAARPHTPTFARDPAVRELLDLLPVTFDPEADLILNRIGHYQTRSFPLVVPPASAGHAILRLDDDPIVSRLSWQGIGDIYWHYPVLRQKPVATVLMRHSDPRMQNSYGAHVLAAVQFVGAGRTAFLAFDSTWRWRKYGEERFNRFWVQIVRYLVEGKLLGGRQRGMLLTEADEYPLGEAVTVTARLFDAGYEPLTRDQVEARYEVNGDRRDLVLKRRVDQPGWYEGRFVPHRTGTYRISLSPPGPGGTANMVFPDSDPSQSWIVREIRVARPNIEIIAPQMDRQALMALARQSDGGQYFEVDETMLIPPLIPDRHEVTTTKSRPIVLWDRWWTLALLVSLLAVEWGVRKWSRLL